MKYKNHIKDSIYKFRVQHKAFRKGGIPFLVNSSKSLGIKYSVCVKQYCSNQIFNRTINTKITHDHNFRLGSGN